MDADVERYRLERAKRGQTSARDAAKIETAARAERERLRKLFVTRFNELRDGQPWRTFADVVGLPASSMNAWTLPDNEKSQPGMEDLRVLATHFGVTTDWLLGMEGAPKNRNQWRTDTILEADLAVYIAREVAKKVRSHKNAPTQASSALPRPEDLGANASRILEEITSREASAWIDENFLMGRRRVLRLPLLWDKRPTRQGSMPWER